MERRRRVEVMLNTLEGERHVQGSLLREIIEVAAGDPELERARRAADELLRELGSGMGEREFDRRVRLISAELYDKHS